MLFSVLYDGSGTLACFLVPRLWGCERDRDVLNCICVPNRCFFGLFPTALFGVFWGQGTGVLFFQASDQNEQRCTVFVELTLNVLLERHL